MQLSILQYLDIFWFELFPDSMVSVGIHGPCGTCGALYHMNIFIHKILSVDYLQFLVLS